MPEAVLIFGVKKLNKQKKAIGPPLLKLSLEKNNKI